MDNRRNRNTGVCQSNVPPQRLQELVLGQTWNMDTGESLHDETVPLLLQSGPPTKRGDRVRGSSLSMKYFEDDAAASIADLIEEEQRKLDRAQDRQLKQEEALVRLMSMTVQNAIRATAGNKPMETRRRGIMSKRSAALRDYHRSETAIRALKEALRLVLLERRCRDGNKHAMPDVDTYLLSRAPAA